MGVACCVGKRNRRGETLSYNRTDQRKQQIKNKNYLALLVTTISHIKVLTNFIHSENK